MEVLQVDPREDPKADRHHGYCEQSRMKSDLLFLCHEDKTPHEYLLKREMRRPASTYSSGT